MAKLTSEHFDRVRDFMKQAKQGTPNKVCMPDEEVRRLRAMLILEEALETVYALGFDAVVEGNFNHQYSVELEAHGEHDLVEIIDGCCDLSVVTYGTLIACGVPDVPFITEVDNNNLEKIANGTIRDDGKLLKHVDHKPPAIADILKTVTVVSDLDEQEPEPRYKLGY